MADFKLVLGIWWAWILSWFGHLSIEGDHLSVIYNWKMGPGYSQNLGMNIISSSLQIKSPLKDIVILSFICQWWRWTRRLFTREIRYEKYSAAGGCFRDNGEDHELWKDKWNHCFILGYERVVRVSKICCSFEDLSWGAWKRGREGPRVHNTHSKYSSAGRMIWTCSESKSTMNQIPSVVKATISMTSKLHYPRLARKVNKHHHEASFSQISPNTSPALV